MRGSLSKDRGSQQTFETKQFKKPEESVLKQQRPSTGLSKTPVCPFKLNTKSVPREFFSLNFSLKVTFLNRKKLGNVILLNKLNHSEAFRFYNWSRFLQVVTFLKIPGITFWHISILLW